MMTKPQSGKIILAAITCMIKKGYNRLSVADIAEEACVSLQEAEEVFPNVSAVFSYVVSDGISKLWSTMIDVVTYGSGVHDKTRIMAGRLIGLFRRFEDCCRLIIFGNDGSVDEAYYAKTLEYLQNCVLMQSGILSGYAAKGLIKDLPYEDLLFSYYSFCFEYNLLAEKKGKPQEQVIDELADYFHSIIRI